MPLYAVTVTCNRRRGYEKDKESIYGLITRMSQGQTEVGHLGWEVQKQENGCLHVHTLIKASREPYVLKHYKYMKDNSLNYHISRIDRLCEIEQWVSYTHKEDHRDTETDYKNAKCCKQS
jgi:hypothetical protein